MVVNLFPAHWGSIKTINNFWISQYRMLFLFISVLELKLFSLNSVIMGITTGGFHELMSFPLRFRNYLAMQYIIPVTVACQVTPGWGCDLSGWWVLEHGLHVIHDALTWISHNISRAMYNKTISVIFMRFKIQTVLEFWMSSS